MRARADDGLGLDGEYRPEVEMHRRLDACEYLDRRGDKKLSPPTQRLAEMFAAWFWPLSFRGTVWLSTRQGWEPPEGGILRSPGDSETVSRAQARFARKYPREPIPSKAAVETALGAFAGWPLSSTPSRGFGGDGQATELYGGTPAAQMADRCESLPRAGASNLAPDAGSCGPS
jgi:hypothetical protein